MPRRYSPLDLSALNNEPIPALQAELAVRLASGAQLDHRTMCLFFHHLVPTPANAAAFAGLYPGLAGKVRAFLAMGGTVAMLKTHFGSFDNRAAVLANQYRNSGCPSPTGRPTDPPDALTEAIMDNCEHCVASLFNCGIFAPGLVFNQHGYALPYVALWTGRLQVLTLLTTLCGGDPGPIAACSIDPTGVFGNAIITMGASFARPDLFKPLRDWCDTFMDGADNRVATTFAAVPHIQLEMCKMGSAETANWMMSRGVDLSALIEPASGDTAWHGAARCDKNVAGCFGFLDWLNAASPATINNRNAAGNTPLNAAILDNNEATMRWFTANLTVAQITAVNPAPANAALTTALDLVISSPSEASIPILSHILISPAYIGTLTVTTSIEARLELLINELRLHRIAKRGDMAAGRLSEYNYQKWWREAQRAAGKKCHILVEHAPSSFFTSDEVQRLKELAKCYKLGRVLIPNFETSAASYRSLRDQ